MIRANTMLACRYASRRIRAFSNQLRTVASVTRVPTFKTFDEHDKKAFAEMIGRDHVVSDSDIVEEANTDWMRKYVGKGPVLLRPGSTEEVSHILQYCNQHKIAVVPQGGNTGLVGGSVPVHDEIILSLSRLNKIHEFDAQSGVIICDAGCVLQQLTDWLEERDHTMPLDLGAKGSCHIGGNIATNAGGLRYLRYGSLHGTVLGLEVVLPDGTILDCMSTLRKDNVGYDLKQLFIGSEGTLGIITKVAMSVPRKPKAVNVSLLGCSSFEQVCEVLGAARSMLGEVLSACEFVDAKAFSLVLEQLPNKHDPLESRHEFYVVIETSGSNDDHDKEKLYAFLEHVMANDVVQDGVVANSAHQATALWALREEVSLSLSARGRVWKYDVSLPLQRMYELVEETRERLKGFKTNGVVVVGYGHLGDSNLHLNISAPGDMPEVTEAVEPFVLEWVAAHGGSISAEHGLGIAKNAFMTLSKPAAAVHLMRQLKNTMDPHGILNPYKVLPQQ